MRKTWFKSGQWNAVCDVCGFNFKNTQLQRRWDGLMVCKDDWEVRHPQELIRPIADLQSPPWTRPNVAEVFVPVTNSATQGCSVLGVYSMAGVGTAGCMLAGNILPGLL